MIVYTIVSPLMGWLGDRYNRRMLLAGGVGLWSLATVGTAFSADFYHMFFWRALLGVGEASYGVIAPALLADLFAVEERGRAMGVYYLALPLGTALGYIDRRAGSRRALGLAGASSSSSACPACWPRSAGPDHPRPGPRRVRRQDARRQGRPAQAQRLPRPFRTPTFVYNTAGMAAVTFATGAYAAWGSTFYQTRPRDVAEGGRRLDRRPDSPSPA